MNNLHIVIISEFGKLKYNEITLASEQNMTHAYVNRRQNMDFKENRLYALCE